MSHQVVLLLAATCGVAAGNIYFPQAISPLVGSALDAPPSRRARMTPGKL
jgi:hypothetical protein